MECVKSLRLKIFCFNNIFMQNYYNIGGNSSIAGYEIEPTRVRVKFSDGKIYSWSYASAGRNNVETMKQLAQSGSGLNSFIMRYVRHAYE